MIHFIQMIREVAAARDILYQLVRQQMILRYRRTVFGYLWTLINPLLMMSVTAIVFANLFHMELKTFAIFMFAGMVAWNCFSSMVIQSTNSLINNEALIKKIYLPKILFPLSVSLGVLIDSVLSLGALFIIILYIGGTPSWALLFLPVAYLLLFMFSLGISLFMSVATVFYRDLQHVIGIALQALFFLTPVIYEKTRIMGNFGMLLKLNPVTYFIDLFRLPIRYGTFPSLEAIGIAAIISLVSLTIGIVLFLHEEKKIVLRL